MEKIVKSLFYVFRKLDKWRLENLAYHLRVGTTILCGSEATYFTDGDGGA